MHTVREKSVKILLLIAILLVSGFTIAIILFGINQFKFGSQLASINQVSNLSHILVRQQANLFSSLLNNNVSAEKLADQLTALSREKFVLDASVYSGNGELLAQSRNALNLRQQLGLEGEKSPQQTQQIVEPIFDGNSVIGFLRVTFDGQYGQTSESKINQQFRYLYAEVIVILLVGALIASSLHYFFRRRKIKLVPMRTLRKSQENQQRSKSFHQQRRRFKR
ncbi:YtjB family periplasmic protein [Gallibacterium anatis]|uniref:Hemolysin regulation protein AhpA n=1 Tax=Gallibacterium anatis TaxID=750 RepID=A0A0A2X9T1_9PAST|nr:AhpA/YtjB family protein [Gallibacterium anatis]KGQ27390.1 hemolysin regulation protein AhpA [Gallibacterium anatis]KGQ27408.1 hemolysin regulation protein AhpA [Gallibacterium anatis]KGQ27947.1 hemolysin regulation protein AhpA [Gallibacterium anatis CCM5995]KGQ32635.1 hemolysin regulation protein AhpA [Gallibacterium anatis]KGQ62941.1 hemolysin regulation protein AhpA [Gallibacterium anatis 7990]